MNGSATPVKNRGHNGGEYSSFHVLIIGAGAAGLLIAQGLKKAGIAFSVFEAVEDETYANRPRDWSMGLHWGRDHIKAQLPSELWARFHEAETDPYSELPPTYQKGFPLINGKTGEEFAFVSAPTAGRVSRRRLTRLFENGIQVNYGKRLERVDTDGKKTTAYFADGSMVIGDALVGADSVGSTVRQKLLSPEHNKLDTLPVVFYNFPLKFTAEQSLYVRQEAGHPLINYSVHPDIQSIFVVFVLEVPDPSDPSTWLFQIIFDKWGSSEYPPSSAERLAHLRECAKQYCEPYRTIASWIPDDVVIHANKMRHLINTRQWDNHNGRLTLAGDAAHSILPYRGQGLNNAMQDASQFVEAIKSVVKDGKDLATAITEYDTEVFARGERETKISREQAEAYHDWEALMSSPIVTQGFHQYGKPKNTTGEGSTAEKARERVTA